MNILYLTLLFPLVGFLLLIYSNGNWSNNIITTISIGSIGLSVLTTIWVGLIFLNTDVLVFNQTLWNWISIGNFKISIALNLDSLSLTMLLMITIIGFLVYIYSTWYMQSEKEYSRFFAYTNLFIFSMLILVLADNLLFMYVGWEGVGFCSYLLISFYNSKLKNSISAIKSFIFTKIGDILLLFALFILYIQFKTLNFNYLTLLFSKEMLNNNILITLASLMFIGSAIGKSAQFPLQVWLTDAMVAPTPVSALVHASTMVTAGVYLIIRMSKLFLMVPIVFNFISIIGAITILLSCFSALVQNDIKKILAYSTMSQMGYIFLAIGVQSYNVAIFHLIIHSFFKTLLFLSSGSIILILNNEQNIFKMGGLYKLVPLIYICFLTGGSALSALPIVTAGFYSKEAILYSMLNNGHSVLILISLIGSFLTSIYTFRMIFIIFHGKTKIKKINFYKSINHDLPLIILLILSTFIGAKIILPFLGIFQYNISIYGNTLKFISSFISFFGVYIAYMLWLSNSNLVNVISSSTYGRLFFILWFYSWGLNWLYDKIFVKPYLIIVKLLSCDPLNIIMNFPVFLVNYIVNFLKFNENGKLHWYLTLISFGALIIMIFLIFF